MYKSYLTPHFWEGFVCCCFQILNKPDTWSLYVSVIGLHCMGGFYCPLYYSYIITFSWCRKVECPKIMECRKQTLSHEVVWTTRRPKMESMADDWLKWRLTNGSHDRWRIVEKVLWTSDKWWTDIGKNINYRGNENISGLICFNIMLIKPPSSSMYTLYLTNSHLECNHINALCNVRNVANSSIINVDT